MLYVFCEGRETDCRLAAERQSDGKIEAAIMVIKSHSQTNTHKNWAHVSN